MWQRIQTLWLLLSGVAMTLLLFKPMALLLSKPLGKLYEMGIFGLKEVGGDFERFSFVYFVLALLVVLIAFGTIFLYKRRILQVRLCVFNILITIGFLAYFAFQTWDLSKALEAEVSFRVWLAMPIVSIILQYLAMRRIGIDEAMVRAANRLR